VTTGSRLMGRAKVSLYGASRFATVLALTLAVCAVGHTTPWFHQRTTARETLYYLGT
jgi:hypothetical protein